MRRIAPLLLTAIACSTPESNFDDSGVDGGDGGVACSAAGYGECVADDATECETYVWADEAHCGNCRTSCMAGELCVAGACETPEIVSAGLGGGFTCVLLASGHVMCWGNSGQGMLGTGHYSEHTADPVAVLELDDAVGLEVAMLGACAIRGPLREVQCWGDNGLNHFGPLVDGQSHYPYPVDLLGADAPVEDVSISFFHTCVRTAAQALCAGSNRAGELGRADLSLPTSPLLGPLEGLPAREIPRAISAGGPGGAGHTCVAMTDGFVYCAGYNSEGECAQPAEMSNVAPATRVANVQNVVDVESGSGFSCAIDEAGAVYCWGSNTHGQTGNGSVATEFRTPQRVNGLPAISQLAASGSTVLAVSEDGASVWGWGDGTAGQLGQGPTILVDTRAPVQIPTTAGATYEVFVGNNHACMLERRPGMRARLLCAGRDRSGELGLAAAGTVPTFVPVPTLP